MTRAAPNLLGQECFVCALCDGEEGKAKVIGEEGDFVRCRLCGWDGRWVGGLKEAPLLTNDMMVDYYGA